MKNKESNCHSNKCKIWSLAPKGAGHQDELDDWLSVVMWLRLRLNLKYALLWKNNKHTNHTRNIFWVYWPPFSSTCECTWYSGQGFETAETARRYSTGEKVTVLQYKHVPCERGRPRGCAGTSPLLDNKPTALSHVTSCGLVGYIRFGATNCLHLQGRISPLRRRRQLLVNFHQTTRRYVPQNCSYNIHRCQNLTSKFCPTDSMDVACLLIWTWRIQRTYL
jgi:hypothetical protein